VSSLKGGDGSIGCSNLHTPPHYYANVWIYPEETPPLSMGCHTDNMQPKPFMSPVDTCAFKSWMEDIIHRALGPIGQFPRVGLMELLVHHGGWAMMGMGGMRKVTSTPLMLLHFIWFVMARSTRLSFCICALFCSISQLYMLFC
jgi:hypothetical protein